MSLIKAAAAASFTRHPVWTTIFALLLAVFVVAIFLVVLNEAAEFLRDIA